MMVEPKPIVVLTPKAEREALRSCGTLPAGFFRMFGCDSASGPGVPAASVPAIYLWEHEIDYKRGEVLAARIEERPADIPVFFGMQDSADDDQRQANEVEITRLLDSVVVHVVFLDNREGDGRGYAEFRSFAEIADWSRHFNKVLSIRFPNEYLLRNTENVLVIVARGEQVKVSREELAAFNGCIGEVKAFKSCYFLDYNLGVDESRELFHSRAVWNVMVGRLLLGFLLSRVTSGTANSSKPFWLRPGVKIWRAAECVVEVSADFIEKQVGDALAKAYKRVQALVDSEKQVVMEFGTEEPLPGLKIEELKPSGSAEWEMPSGGWSDFPGEACAVAVANPARWDDALETARQSIDEWKRKQPVLACDGEREARGSFDCVHEKPGQVFSLTKKLFGALAQDRASAKECGSDALEQRWNAVVQAEQARRAMIGRAQNEARELRRAQNHYVGMGFGLVVVAAVSALCGWVLSQLISGIGGSIVYSIWLASATALGSFGVFCLVLFLHWRAGRKGAEAFIETCKTADRQMQIRHERVKAIIEAAICAKARRRRLNTRFRAWTLLERIKSVVITEIQPAAALVDHLEPTESGGVSPESSAGRRSAFIAMTRKPISSLNPVLGDDAKNDQEVESWWGAKPKDGDENFRVLWSRLCKLDKTSTGHLPVSVFVPKIREFVSRFTARIHCLAVAGVIHENQEKVKGALLKWVNEDVLNSSVRRFVSGSIEAQHDQEARQLPAIIFVQNKEQELGVDALILAVQTDVGPHSYQIFPSDHLEFAGQLGFMYQEFTVEFDRNEQTGHLTFKEVRDA
jgi:hypothetical protein